MAVSIERPAVEQLADGVAYLLGILIINVGLQHYDGVALCRRSRFADEHAQQIGPVLAFAPPGAVANVLDVHPAGL